MTREELIEYIEDNDSRFNININNSTDEELLLFVEQHKYIKRRKDGQAFSDAMGVKLVLSNLDDATKALIDDYFKVAQGFLCQGWWKSALRDLNGRTATAYVSQELLDDIRLQMSNYILQSYN
jgi:hypothetical protein